MTIDLSKHPCFNKEARHEFGRVHLPVAPKCNIQCNYCNRKYDCANENRPGVSNGVLSPGQALFYLKRIVEKEKNIAVVGIAGPGDAFATPEATLETLRLVRKEYPEMILCVATNGLNVAPFVPELASLKVSHVTITMNAVDAEVGSEIYSWVRDGKVIYRKQQAAELLIERQLEAIRLLHDYGITVKVNTIAMPGVNDECVEAIASRVKELGADIMNCIPLLPVEDTLFENMTPPTDEEIAHYRKICGTYLPQMEHCTRCRADAVGLLGKDASFDAQKLLAESSRQPLNPCEDRPNVAVASLEGFLVNQHLGEASHLMVFTKDENGYRLMETRAAPPAGGGDRRWKHLAEILHDCKALLTSGAGAAPTRVLERTGIRVVMMEGLIEEGLHAVYNDKDIRAPLRCEHRCGSGCAGTGTGCM